MRVLLAPDKFKGSASASQVAEALGRGIFRARPDAQIERHPIADGGEGTVELLLSHGFRPVSTEVTGPLGHKVTATYAMKGDHAVVEAATAYGLGLVPDGPTSVAARCSSSYGVGELIAEARRAGASTITVALGGSAGTDGGAGALQALGAAVLDQNGSDLPGGGESLARVANVDMTPVRALLAGIDLTVACDVDNPLLGPSGSAAGYAAQKGASIADIALLQDSLATWADVVAAHNGRRIEYDYGTGAAGGLAFGLAAVGARIVSGLETMMDMTGLTDRLASADLIVVAEGTLDEQSLHGKGPIGIAHAAAPLNVPVVAVAGQCTLSTAQQHAAGLRAVHTLNALEPDLAASMRDAEQLLEKVGANLAASDLVLNLTGGETSSGPRT